MFLLLALLTVCPGGSRAAVAASAPSPSAAFDAANRLYEQGNFAGAIQAYEAILLSGGSAASLHFNLGNACFKSGQVGRAIASYRRAEQLAPRDPDLRANLQFVRNQITGPTLTPARWQRWLNTFTANEWTLATSALLWTCLLLLAAVRIRPAWRQPLRLAVILTGAGVLILAGCLAAVIHSGTIPAAVVIAPEATVRNGPLDESPAAFTVHDGAELQVLDEKDQWLQVTAGTARIGWIHRDQTMPLPRI